MMIGAFSCLDTPASMRLPKNFQPVGTSKHLRPSFSATLSSAPLVGILLATPCSKAHIINFTVDPDYCN